MPIFRVDQHYHFPPVHLADEDGLLAYGGDLHPTRILHAYHQGIFPWFNEDEEILWWSPDPRFVLYPHKLKIHKSMRGILNNPDYRFALNQNFDQVVHYCSEIDRPGQDGTWITHDMKKAYSKLHSLQFAISAECYYKNELCGGLYGILLSGVFCGESMFSRRSNASKYTFIHLVSYLQTIGVKLIDCQVYTSHLESLGAEMISRKEYLSYLPPFPEGLE